MEKLELISLIMKAVNAPILAILQIYCLAKFCKNAHGTALGYGIEAIICLILFLNYTK